MEEVIFVGIDGRQVELMRDEASKTLVSINIDHAKVHDGLHFTVADYDSAVAAATPKKWLLKTPDTATRIHVKLAVIVNNESLVEFFENPTVSVDGTGLSEINNDRTSAIVSELSAFKDPTTTADGTLIDTSLIGTNNPKTVLGGDTRLQAEFILKQNEDYMIKVTVENDNTKVNLLVEFYEVK